MVVVISLQIFVTLANLMLVLTTALHLSPPSPTKAIQRASRSIVMGMMMNKEQAQQKCLGCENGDDEGSCPKSTFRQVMRYEQQLKCMPEPTLIKLRVPAPHFSVKPSMARVNRCSGYCRDGYNTCLPTKTSFAKIPVLLKNHHKGFAKCVEYEVEEHEECACECEIRKEHCSERHKHENCFCKCQNELEKYQCLDEDKVWDEEKCECTCMGAAGDATMCPPELMWDTKECRCEMILPADISENLLY